MRCRRDNNTFYGTGGTCRKGVQDEYGWVGEFAERFPSLKSSLQSLKNRVEALQGDEKEVFKKAINEQLGVDNLRKNWENEKGEVKKKGEKGRAYTEQEKEAALKSQVNGWNKLLDNGYPKVLVLRNGENVIPPSNMVPIVTRANGQPGYNIFENEKSAGRFNPKLGNGVYTQNRSNNNDVDRVLTKISEFKKSQEASGLQWPTQKLQPRTDIELNTDKILASLTVAEKRSIALRGLPIRGDKNMPGAELKRWYEQPENKAFLEQRLRDIVDRYVEQGGRSGITGNPVNLPGLPARREFNEEKSTVDHFNPISGGKKLLPPDIRTLFDHKGNFLITEEGPNQARQNASWSSWLDKRLKNQQSNTAVLQRASTQVQSALDARKQRAEATREKLKARFEKQINNLAKRLKVSPSTVKADPDFLRIAIGDAGIKKLMDLEFTS